MLIFTFNGPQQFCYFYFWIIYWNVKSFLQVLYVKCRNASLHTCVSLYLTLITIHNSRAIFFQRYLTKRGIRLLFFLGMNLKCKQCTKSLHQQFACFLPIANVTTSFIQPRTKIHVSQEKP